MSDESVFADMESFFMALADKTRLRLLNLMRDEEVCVCFFTEVLSESQPKISRHLAYLRNAGIVQARREGKWMHYSISPAKDANEQRVLKAIFEWFDSREEMRRDREMYSEVCCSPEIVVQIARTPMTFMARNGESDAAAADSRFEERRHNELEEFLL